MESPKTEKHSSFARQQIVYGCGTVKIHAIYLNNGPHGIENKHWRFKHEKNLQDLPDPLNNIRRSNRNVQNSRDVSDLKAEVKLSREKVVSITSDFHQLRT
mmetsp:Transcript_8313/g.10441  ORF Transcript_8313/g.10441 Transcript_8313/m.10441 type:complete len:101 (-) Transcript_8313:590-892(-)